MASIWSDNVLGSVLGGAFTLGGLALGTKRNNKATSAFQQAVTAPPPPVSGPMGFFSGGNLGFNPQTQQNFNAFNDASLEQLRQLGAFEGVNKTAFQNLQQQYQPVRESQLASLRNTLNAQGRLELEGKRPSRVPGQEGQMVGTNPELQSFFEANALQDLQAAQAAYELQNLLRSGAVNRATALQGQATNLNDSLYNYARLGLVQQQNQLLAAQQGLKNDLANSNNFSSILTTIGKSIFKQTPLGKSLFGGADKAVQGATGNVLSTASNLATAGLGSLGGQMNFAPAFQALQASTPGSFLAGAPGLPGLGGLGIGGPTLQAGVPPLANAFGTGIGSLGAGGGGAAALSGLAGPGAFGGSFSGGAGAAAGLGGAGSAAGAGGGGALGLTSGLGGLGLLGAGTLGLIGGLGLMTIGGNEKAVYTKHPQGLWSVESFLGGEPTLKPGRAGDEHGKTNPGKPASIGAREDFLMRPSKQADGFRQIEAQNQAAIQLYGADVKTLQLSGRLTPDMAFRIQQIGNFGHDPGAQATFQGHIQQRKAKKAERERQKELRHPGGRGN